MSASNSQYQALIESARQAAKKTYSPYSNFPVGAAVLTSDGRTFAGCNVENASYGGAICAERVALVKAVSEGCRQFQAVAVFCEKAPGTWPCGICRQFLSEFGTDMDIVTLSQDGALQCLKLGDLLPRNFGPDDLN